MWPQFFISKEREGLREVLKAPEGNSRAILKPSGYRYILGDDYF